MSELKICNKCEGTPLEKLADFCGFPNCYGTHEEMTVLALDQHKEITRLKERVEVLESFVFDLSFGAIDGEFIEEAADELYNKANTGE